MDFLKGIRYYFKGIKFLFTNPKLFKYIIIPWIISGIIIMCMVYIGKHAWDVYNFKIHHLFNIALYFIKVIICFIIVLITLIIFFLLSSIFNGFFLNLLSYKVEEIKRKRIKVKKENFVRKISRKVKIIFYSLIEFIFLGFLLIISNFIPILGQIVSTLIMSYYTAKNYLNYVFERNNLSYIERKKRIKNNILKILGFGFICFLSLLVPIFNFFAHPLNIIGGTLLGVDLLKKNK